MKKCFQRVEGTNLWTIDPSRHEDILAPESRCIGRKRRSFSSTAGDAAAAAAPSAAPSAAPARIGSPTSKRQAAPRPHATPTKKRATVKVARAAKPLPSAAVTTNADAGTNATASMEEGFYDQLVANGMLPGGDDADSAGAMDAHSPTSATEPLSPQAFSDSGSCSPLQSAGLPRPELGTELEYTSFLRNAVANAETSTAMGSSLLWPSSGLWEPDAGTALLLGGFAPEMMSCTTSEAEDCLNFGLSGTTANGSGAFDGTSLNVLDGCASVGDLNSPFLPDIFA
jgi:hypothetical protein